MRNAQSFLLAMNVLFPKVDNFLHAETDFQFLVAIMLSAQMTDIGVNKATKQVFEMCKTPKHFLEYGQENLLRAFSSINFYPTKTKNIIATANILINEYDEKIPKTRKELIKLPGVGNKTAGVFLLQKGYDFAFPVDTHIARVAKGFGFTISNSPDEIEKNLQRIFPKESWNLLHKQMILYGRTYFPAKYKNMTTTESWNMLENILKSVIQ